MKKLERLKAAGFLVKTSKVLCNHKWKLFECLPISLFFCVLQHNICFFTSFYCSHQSVKYSLVPLSPTKYIKLQVLSNFLMIYYRAGSKILPTKLFFLMYWLLEMSDCILLFFLLYHKR